jgi:two-component system, NarL family, invasion response regulator UvrY
MSGRKINVCLVDDHKLLRKGMVELIDGFTGYQVIGECNNGKEFMTLLKSMERPDIALLDINMPEMDGYETAIFLSKDYPEIKVIALSMYDDEKSIIRMIKAGARGYVLKDADPTELRKAFDDVVSKGYYYSDLVSGVLVQSLHYDDAGNQKKININDREAEFLKFACTELTYKEIADRMCLAPRTIDGYREALFEKLNVKSRVGLVMYAIRNGLVKME